MSRGDLNTKKASNTTHLLSVILSEDMNERKPEPPPLLRRVMPELDSVRGVAVLMVVLYHGFAWSYPLEGSNGLAKLILLTTRPGWLGVELFFVLSGFLITGILLETRNQRDFYRRFYIRRGLRILPAYFALLLLLALLRQAHFASIALCVLFLANLSPLFRVTLEYGPLWSLAVEEHFYLVWPALVRTFQKATLKWVCIGICCLEPCLRLIWAWKFSPEGLYTYTWLKLDGLALGSLLAIWLREPSVTRRSIKRAAFLLACVGLGIIGLGARFGILSRTQTLGMALQYTPWCILFSGFLLFVLLIGTSRFSRWVRFRVLRFFGQISYGLYLFHLVPFVWYDQLVDAVLKTPGHTVPAGAVQMCLRFVFASSIAILVATLSRQYFEQFFLNLKDKIVPDHNPAGTGGGESRLIPLCTPFADAHGGDLDRKSLRSLRFLL
jgi:peptidoglycan/LPS O-acetylase OafA/YrhL